MMDDLISRSALVADLESRKAAAADPVIRLLFDRLIEVVEAQPAVDAVLIKRDCCTCKYGDRTTLREPCRDCWGRDDAPKWERADENL